MKKIQAFAVQHPLYLSLLFITFLSLILTFAFNVWVWSDSDQVVQKVELTPFETESPILAFCADIRTDPDDGGVFDDILFLAYVSGNQTIDSNPTNIRQESRIQKYSFDETEGEIKCLILHDTVPKKKIERRLDVGIIIIGLPLSCLTESDGLYLDLYVLDPKTNLDEFFPEKIEFDQINVPTLIIKSSNNYIFLTEQRRRFLDGKQEIRYSYDGTFTNSFESSRQSPDITGNKIGTPNRTCNSPPDENSCYPHSDCILVYFNMAFKTNIALISTDIQLLTDAQKATMGLVFFTVLLTVLTTLFECYTSKWKEFQIYSETNQIQLNNQK